MRSLARGLPSTAVVVELMVRLTARGSQHLARIVPTVQLPCGWSLPMLEQRARTRPIGYPMDPPETILKPEFDSTRPTGERIE